MRKEKALEDYRNWKLSERRRNIKIKAVEYLGGKCEICGYNKSYAAMDFHHLDPTQKDKAISRICNRKWSVIKDELDKCRLLCANCHREIHEEITLNDSVRKEKEIRSRIKERKPTFVKCYTCGAKKKCSPSRAKMYKRHFCSKECRAKVWRESIRCNESSLNGP